MSNMVEIGNLLGTTESAEADSGATTVEITMVEAFGDTMYSTQGGNEPGLKRCDCEETEEETLDVRPPADQTDVPVPPLHPQPLLPQPLLPQPLLPQPLLPQPLLPQPLLSQPLLSQPLLPQPLLSQPLLSQPLLSQPQRITVPEEKTHYPQVQEWTVGSRCRATYALDGLSYPAVVLEVRGQRCRVRFDNYNNEEEVEVSSLLSFDELNGPSRSGRATAPWNSAFGTTARRRREALEDGDKREPERVERDRVDRSERGRDRNRKDPQLGPKLPRDRSRAPSREDERKSAESMAYSVFSCPPFPPPLHSSGDWWTSMPPPPLPSFLPGSSDASPVPESLSHMLMMWYMCGFHTGSYLTLQQLKSPPRDSHKTGPF